MHLYGDVSLCNSSHVETNRWYHVFTELTRLKRQYRNKLSVTQPYHTLPAPMSLSQTLPSPPYWSRGELIDHIFTKGTKQTRLKKQYYINICHFAMYGPYLPLPMSIPLSNSLTPPYW